MDFLVAEIWLEKLVLYGGVFLIIAIVLGIYLLKLRRETRRSESKIELAKENGLYEPVSLHPVIHVNKCIKSGACAKACPETDVLGISNGRGTVINASHCIGHGACFHACPVEAITLNIGTETRGVDLPHVSQSFETNVKGIFIAGELGGMGLIKNAVEQGRQAVENMTHHLPKKHDAAYDLIIVGAGPAGISASLTARKHQLNFVTLEQDSLGGAVFTYPRAKVVMTAPMDLPLHGKVKLSNTSKAELLNLWVSVLTKNGISIRETTKVESIEKEGDHFKVTTSQNESLTAARILLTIGRRGTPRKLGVPGEDMEKVRYRLLDPEIIQNQRIIVVGGGDSAVESAMMLAEQNDVTLSYRSGNFNRIKPGNATKLEAAVAEQKLTIKYFTNVAEIQPEQVILKNGETNETEVVPNDLIYIFAGGELPTEFLKKTGITITRKFGDVMMKH